MWGLGLAALIGAISSGVEPSVAWGYYFVPILLSFVESIASKTFEDVGIEMTPIYVWAAILATAVGTLAV